MSKRIPVPDIYTCMEKNTYIYQMATPIPVIRSPETEARVSSHYVIEEEVHRFLCSYAKGMVNVDLPTPEREPRYLSRKDALNIGKSMLTIREWKEEYLREWLEEHTTMTLQKVNRRNLWSLNALFLEGDSISIHGWRHASLFTFPSTGWAHLNQPDDSQALKESKMSWLQTN